MEKSLLGYMQTHRNPNSLVISQKGTCWSIVDACGLVFTSYPQQRRSTLWVTQSYKQSHACALCTLPKPLKHFPPQKKLFPTCAFSSALILITVLAPTSRLIPRFPIYPLSLSFSPSLLIHPPTSILLMPPILQTPAPTESPLLLLPIPLETTSTQLLPSHSA